MAKDKLIQLEEENARLKRAVEELSVLNEIATTINSTLTVNRMVDLIVQKCVKHLNVEQAAVQLLEKHQEEELFQTMVRHADTSGGFLPIRLDTEITGWMLHNKKPLIVNDFAADERFQRLADEKMAVRSLLSVPLLVKGNMIGILNTVNKKSADGFSQEDQRLLSIIATQSAQVLENARLLEEEQALIRFREEMRMASDIQQNLLPKKQPDLNGYDIAGRSLPAKDVGGDYYDFITMDDGHLAFCLGDVTGKGLPAAMLMANIQATIRSQALMNTAPREAIRHANLLMYQSTALNKFVTMFYGILNIEDHSMTVCNAGHDQPYMVHENGITGRLPANGVVLGFVPQFDYTDTRIELQSGARLIIYSDGVTEAMNDAEEEFGEERLEKMILENRDLGSAALIEKIYNAVQAHAGSGNYTDDMTMVIITRK